MEVLPEGGKIRGAYVEGKDIRIRYGAVFAI